MKTSKQRRRIFFAGIILLIVTALAFFGGENIAFDELVQTQTDIDKWLTVRP